MDSWKVIIAALIFLGGCTETLTKVPLDYEMEAPNPKIEHQKKKSAGPYEVPQ